LSGYFLLWGCIGKTMHLFSGIHKMEVHYGRTTILR
jgi:hypothetical protein